MTLRVVVAGAGDWARRAHLPALSSLSDLLVVGITDLDPERAQRVASEFNIPAFSESLMDLLPNAGADLVAITAPSGAHLQLAEQAIASGAAVFCEKPLTNSIADSQRLVMLAHAAGTATTIGFSFRYTPAMQLLKHDIDSGVLGEIWFVELFEYNAQFHPALGKSVGWKGDPDHARAGSLLEYGTHVLDLAAWLAGPIESVHGSLARVLPAARLDDIASVQLRFAKPATGILVSGWTLYAGVPGIRVRVHGSKHLGEVDLGFIHSGYQAYTRYSPAAEPLVVLREAGGLDPAENVRRHYADFTAQLQGRQPASPGTLPQFEEGLRAQRAIEAALAADAGWVQTSTAGI